MSPKGWDQRSWRKSCRAVQGRVGECLDEIEPEPELLATDDATLASFRGFSVVGRVVTGVLGPGSKLRSRVVVDCR